MMASATKLTADQEEILTLRDRVYDLEQRNEELRRLLVGPKEPMNYPPEWLLTASEATILTALMTAADGLRSRDQIQVKLYPHKARDVSKNIISVFVSKIRNKLGRFGIRISTRRGMGYELSAADRVIIATKIEKWKSGDQTQDRTMTALPQNKNASPS